MKKAYQETMCSLLIGLGLMTLITGCGNSSTSNIQVGVGETVITPEDPVGWEMRGFDRGGNRSTGIHDDLHARTVLVEGSNENTTALVTVSVISLGEDILNRIREGIQEETGIPGENIIISATHTHSAPDIGDPETDEYTRFLIDRTVQSAVQAWENRVPGRVGIESAHVLGAGVNRSTLGHGGLTPDPEAAVIKVEDARGNLLGVFFNYGKHPATLDLHNLEFTEDWPYFTIRDIKEEVGEDVIVGFFQGAEGNINSGYSAELSAVGAYMYGIRTFDYAEQKGRIVSLAVLETLPSIETTDALDVEVAFDYFDFPRRTTYPWTSKEALQWQEEAQAQLDEARSRAAADLTTDEEARKWQAEARELAARGELDTRSMIGPRALDEYKKELWTAGYVASVAQRIEALPENPDPIRMSMQAVRLGETVFVTFPNEVFAEIGVAVKEQSPFGKTYIIGLAGGRGGYIPTAAEYLEGGYVANGTPFAPQTEQVLIDASLEMISRVSSRTNADSMADKSGQ